MTNPTSEEQHVRQEIRRYLVVFVALVLLTFLVVTLSYLRINRAAVVTLLLLIAAAKASLVGCYFMHLLSERAAVYSLLALTVIVLVCILLLPLFELFNAA